MGNAHKVERNRSRGSKRNGEEGIHEHRILRATISFGSGAENIRSDIEQKRQRIPRKFLGNVGRKGTYKNHRRAEDCNGRRNPEGFHNTIIGIAAVQFVLRQIPVQTLIEPERRGVCNRQEKRLSRNKDTKLSGAKNTRHHESQKRAANLEDSPHHVYDHRLFQELTVCFQITHNYLQYRKLSLWN